MTTLVDTPVAAAAAGAGAEAKAEAPNGPSDPSASSRPSFRPRRCPCVTPRSPRSSPSSRAARTPWPTWPARAGFWARQVPPPSLEANPGQIVIKAAVAGYSTVKIAGRRGNPPERPAIRGQALPPTRPAQDDHSPIHEDTKELRSLRCPPPAAPPSPRPPPANSHARPRAVPSAAVHHPVHARPGRVDRHDPPGPLLHARRPAPNPPAWPPQVPGPRPPAHRDRTRPLAQLRTVASHL